MTPKQRSLKLLREMGYEAENTEVYVKPSGMTFGIRKDVLGLFDIMAFQEPNIFLGVQCCALSGVAAHKKKAEENPWLVRWLKSNNHFVIHGWPPWNEEDKRDEPRIVSAYLEGWQEHVQKWEENR